jgi:transposase
MGREKLTDAEWHKIYPILKSNNRIYVGNGTACRRFINAVLWMMRSGAQWRLLPSEHGKWNSVFKRFDDWCKKDVWDYLHEKTKIDLDLEHVFIDSTIIKAHACAAGAAGSTSQSEALGRSVGGHTTKIHAVADALGNPIDFILTEGQASDVGQALPLLELVPEGAQAVMADKAYDCNEVIEAVKKRKMIAVIPPKSNRINPHSCDFVLYKERHLIECFFCKIKHYRRIFSRFEKKVKNYMGFLRFVSALIWLR